MNLPGVKAAWSRTVEVEGADGSHTWHYLDNGAEPVHGTLLCVHGNPTWSYLWRRFLAEAPAGWRVVAPDQLGMGLSDRAAPRRLADRVTDLEDFTRAVGIDGPVVLAVHDWGGAIGLGWALRHREQVRALVLTNTAVWQPQDKPMPAVLRLVTHPRAHRAATVTTPAFVIGTTGVSRPRPPREVREAFALPYRTAALRQAVGQFVADIPAWPGHPSHPALREIAESVRTLDVPALALWGPRDPVFTDLYLRDLRERLPQLDIHRFEGASHLVAEDRPEAAALAWRWIGARLGADVARTAPVAPALPSRGPDDTSPLPTRRSRRRAHVPWEGLVAPDRSLDLDAVAIREMSGATITFGELRTRVLALAYGLVRDGLRPGDRVGVLVPPGIELTVAVYGVWVAGGVVVVADAGLGYGKLARCLKGAHVDAVMGIPAAIALADALRIPGRRYTTVASRLARHAAVLGDLERSGAQTQDPLPNRAATDDCAALFTSGATGPSKGVVYTNAQINAQVETLRRTFRFGPAERFVAAFAPFALYGPALLMPSVVPDIDVTKPDTLTAAKLADAVAAIDATLVFAAPAALRNVVATASDLDDGQREALTGPRLVLSAGAPVPAALLRQVKQVLPNAETHTPYGMTEALPVTDVDPAAARDAGASRGVYVGHAVPGVHLAIAPLDEVGRPMTDLVETPEVLGEVAVAGPHVKDRYLHLWGTQAESAVNPAWHRTGDIGHLDSGGGLWVEGRVQHVLSTPDGPVAPVAVEQTVEALPHVAAAACVGVGPAGTQAVVVIVQPTPGVRVRRALAPASLARLVRARVEVPVAAVLLRRELPTDIRHRSKIDRTALAAWAARVLRGTDAPGTRLARLLPTGAGQAMKRLGTRAVRSTRRGEQR